MCLELVPMLTGYLCKLVELANCEQWEGGTLLLSAEVRHRVALDVGSAVICRLYLRWRFRLLITNTHHVF